MDKSNFYTKLPIHEDFGCIADVDRFSDFPPDWIIIVTDITQSTIAVNNGKYREVNTIGASVIAAILNIAGDTVIPYVFGGDGATLCIPPELKKSAIDTLAEVQKISLNSFELTLRTGMISVAEVTERGHRLRVARCRMSDYLVSAMFTGDGLEAAETLIKSGVAPIDMTSTQLDIDRQNLFSGLECRWDRIPSRHGETISLIVKTSNSDEYQNAIIYAEVISKIKQIYGTDETHCPLHLSNLNLSLSNKKLQTEFAIRTFNTSNIRKIFYWLKIRLQILISKLSDITKNKIFGFDALKYKSELIKNSDYKKFDGMLRMVISGGAKQREQLCEYLETLESEGKLHFGLHCSDSAQITCLIFNRKQQHIHFIDGADGGYTMAAIELKKKTKS